MKLILATGIYPPEIGGPAGYVKGVAKAFTAKGHLVTVVTYGDDKTEKGDGYEVKVIKRNGGSLIRYFRYALITWKLAQKSDLIYVQGPVSEGVPAAIASFLCRKPLVLKIVGDYAWEQYMQSPLAETKPESLDEFLERKHQGKFFAYEIVERWVAKRAKRIIVASKYMKRAITKWGIEPEKISVIYNAIELERVVGDRQEVRRQLGLPLDAKLALTAGRIIYWKRLDVVLQAALKLDSSWKFLMAGDGPMREKWENLAKKFGLDDRVIWLGRIDRKLVWQYMAACDVFLVPSSLETFSFVLLEALAQGCRAVISDRGGMLEIAEKYPELVTVCKYEDSEAMALAMETKYNPTRANPIDLQDFSATIMLDQTEDLLQKLLI